MAIRDSTRAFRTQLLRDAEAVIQANLGSDLTLDSVAAEVATSRRQLQRCFRELEHTTFRDYVTMLRMRHAARLLRSGQGYQVKDVARAVGYRHHSHFTKTFRKVHGVNPSAFTRGQVGAPEGGNPDAARGQRPDAG